MAPAGTAAGDFVLLGRVTKPHGIRGEVKVHPFSGRPENFLQYREILLAPEQSEQRISYRINRVRVQGKQVLLELEKCASRTDAEALVGWQVWLRSQDLPELADNEFYLRDLEGKKITTTEGLELGQVTGLLETAAHDILVITGRNHEYMVPVQKDFIVSVNDEEVVLDVPPGLLEINR